MLVLFLEFQHFSFWPVEFMLSFLIASSGPETAMNDMQRSASSGTRESRAPSSVVRTRGPHSAAPCGGNRAEGKFYLLQTLGIARNGENLRGIQRRRVDADRNRNEPHARRLGSLLPAARGRGLVACAGPPQTRSGSRGCQAVAPARPTPAPDRAARGRPCPSAGQVWPPRARRAAREADDRPESPGNCAATS